jgi:hypothetical protein
LTGSSRQIHQGEKLLDVLLGGDLVEVAEGHGVSGRWLSLKQGLAGALSPWRRSGLCIW